MTHEAMSGEQRTPRRADPHANAKWPIYAATVISWLGFLVHNVADLPGQTFLGPETFWPSLVTGVLLLLYSVGPRRVAAIGLFIWAALNFLGAGDRTAPGSTALRYRADAAPLLLPRAVRRHAGPMLMLSGRFALARSQPVR